MGREFRIISALAGHRRPGAARGRPLRGRRTIRSTSWVGSRARSCATCAAADAFPDPADRRAIGERVVDTLVAIHAVDPDAVGLGELAKKEDYVARQLHRWQGQWEKQHTRELPLVGRGPRPARRPDPRPGPGDDRPRRLPARQHDPHRRRRGRRGRRLGAVHARRPARRRRPAAGLLGRATATSCMPLLEPATLAEGFPHRDEVAGLLRRALGPRPLRDRLLRRPRPLEAGDHPRGRLRPLRAPASTARPRRRARETWSSCS